MARHGILAGVHGTLKKSNSTAHDKHDCHELELTMIVTVLHLLSEHIHQIHSVLCRGVYCMQYVLCADFRQRKESGYGWMNEGLGLRLGLAFTTHTANILDRQAPPRDSGTGPGRAYCTEHGARSTVCGKQPLSIPSPDQCLAGAYIQTGI